MAERTCLITGASRGIGLATALRLGRAGWDVVAAARGEADLDRAVEQIAATGAGCAAVTADVGDPDTAEVLVSAAVERFGRLDLLVNNAGIATLAPLEELGVDEYERMVAINIDAVFHLTRAAWPVLRRQGGGVVVNVSSMASLDPFPGFAVYGACKAWVNVFTHALATEGRPLGIRVFAVAPGAVETQMLRGAFPDYPTERTLQPDQVAAVIESLTDERMAAASGQTIFVRNP